MRNLRVIILLLFVVSCTNTTIDTKNRYRQKIEFELQIKIPYNFQIVEEERSYAIGDYVETFTLVFSKKDYNSIFKSIDSINLQKFEKLNLYCFQSNNHDGDIISVIFNPDTYTIKYTLMNE